MSNELIRIEVDDDRARRLFEELRERGKNIEVVTAQIADHLYNVTSESFVDEISFDGVPWDRLQDATIRAKDGETKILYRDDNLIRSLDTYNDDGVAMVGVNATYNGFAYGVVHQFGSEKMHVPARPYLPLGEDGELHSQVIADIISMLEDYLEM